MILHVNKSKFIDINLQKSTKAIFIDNKSRKRRLTPCIRTQCSNRCNTQIEEHTLPRVYPIHSEGLIKRFQVHLWVSSNNRHRNCTNLLNLQKTNRWINNEFVAYKKKNVFSAALREKNVWVNHFSVKCMYVYFHTINAFFNVKFILKTFSISLSQILGIVWSPHF